MSNFLNNGDSVEINPSTVVLDIARILNAIEMLVDYLDATVTNLNITYDVLNR